MTLYESVRYIQVGSFVSSPFLSDLQHCTILLLRLTRLEGEGEKGVSGFSPFSSSQAHFLARFPTKIHQHVVFYSKPIDCIFAKRSGFPCSSVKLLTIRILIPSLGE